jgi:hypothetical protein
MAISYSYPMGTPKLTDTVLGVQYEEMKDPAVKNFSISDIADLAVEEIGNITQGPQGPQGPTGAQGVQGNAGTPGAVGPAGLEWEGTWNKNNSYIENDAVSYGGASYFCILDVPGSILNDNPTVDTTHWALLAAQGAQGIQGVQGPTGSQGPAGTITYTDGSLNSGSFSEASTFAKIVYNFSRVYVTTSPNNFIGLTSTGVTTGTAYIVQNKSTTNDLIVRPLDNARFLQPNGFESDVNFTVKPNTYARFTLTNVTGGSDRTFMVEVIKPLGAAPTLQQVTDEGADAYGNNINLKYSSISDSLIQLNVDDFFEPCIKVVNEGVGAAGHSTILGSSTIEFEGNGDYNTIVQAGVGLNNTVTLPSESGTLALTSNITTKVLKTTISSLEILQLFTTPKIVLLNTDPLNIKIPISIYVLKNDGNSYTLNNNAFYFLNSTNNVEATLYLQSLTTSGTGYYQTGITYSNGNMSGVTRMNSYSLQASGGNPTGGTATLDVYVTYIEITL